MKVRGHLSARLRARASTLILTPSPVRRHECRRTTSPGLRLATPSPAAEEVIYHLDPSPTQISINTALICSAASLLKPLARASSTFCSASATPARVRSAHFWCSGFGPHQSRHAARERRDVYRRDRCDCRAVLFRSPVLFFFRRRSTSNNRVCTSLISALCICASSPLNCSQTIRACSVASRTESSRRSNLCRYSSITDAKSRSRCPPAISQVGSEVCICLRSRNLSSFLQGSRGIRLIFHVFGRKRTVGHSFRIVRRGFFFFGFLLHPTPHQYLRGRATPAGDGKLYSTTSTPLAVSFANQVSLSSPSSSSKPRSRR